MAAEKLAAKRAGAKPASRHPPGSDAVLTITTERGLTRYRKQIAARLQANPAAMSLLVINPVMALREVGVELSPKVANHVLHAIAYPPAIREQRTRLIDELRKELGVVPHPSNKEWLARTVFDRLQATPLEIGERTPVYKSSVDTSAVRAIQALLPTRGVTVDGKPQDPQHPIYAAPDVPLACQPQTLNQLDLDATVPDLPVAKKAPAELTLPQLWFYKDSVPLAKPLLQLGIVENSGVYIHGPDNFRLIRDGDLPNDLVSWISGVRIPGTPHAAAHGAPT
jgi:hypothetical protein